MATLLSSAVWKTLTSVELFPLGRKSMKITFVDLLASPRMSSHLRIWRDALFNLAGWAEV